MGFFNDQIVFLDQDVARPSLEYFVFLSLLSQDQLRLPFWRLFQSLFSFARFS